VTQLVHQHVGNQVWRQNNSRALRLIKRRESFSPQPYCNAFEFFLSKSQGCKPHNKEEQREILIPNRIDLFVLMFMYLGSSNWGEFKGEEGPRHCSEITCAKDRTSISPPSIGAGPTRQKFPALLIEAGAPMPRQPFGLMWRFWL